MKSRRNFNLIIILALVLFLSVGYAVVNSVTLTITGSVGAGSEIVDVKFSGEKYISNPNKASIVTLNSNTASVKVDNLSLNDLVKVELEIVNNEEDVPVHINVINTNSEMFFGEGYMTNGYIGVDCNYGRGMTGTPSPFQEEGSSCYSQVTINPKESKTIYLGFFLVKTPITEEDSHASFEITVEAVPFNA